jgi:DNA modification methylase
MKSQVIQGNNIDVLRTFPDNHFDSIVTDPPYGIDFLGKAWDANTGALETYAECLRVLKPGGHILAFSAARTYHHLAVTVEQAGFEIRDQIMWIYSSGFPKSQDIGRSIQRSLGVKEKQPYKHNVPVNGGAGDTKHYENEGQIVVTDPVAKQWSGWGTALKPAHEPICLARKPIKLSIAKNCQTWGVGALHIDATRIAVTGLDTRGGGADGWDRVEFGQAEPNKTDGSGYVPNEAGRFPSNVIGDIAEPYQKYFYCPKVGRAERHVGFDEIPDPLANYAQGDVKNHPLWDPSIGTNVQRLKHKILEHNKTLGQQHQVQGAVGNNHPTVKPIELMKYLIQLVTPAGGRVLDPFNGSGSTGCAAVELDMDYTGIELDPAYVDIARKRIAAWYAATHATTFTELFDTE